MNNIFDANWRFSESYMSEIKEILKSNAMHIVKIEVASEQDDKKHSTDLKIRVSSGDVAVRIRRSYQQFRDLTIRAKNGNSKTEIHKLRDGYADWYLYLWTDSGGICDWILVDIQKMRDSGMLSEARPVKINNDGYTGFYAYSILELQRVGALVARKNT